EPLAVRRECNRDRGGLRVLNRHGLYDLPAFRVPQVHSASAVGRSQRLTVGRPGEGVPLPGGQRGECRLLRMEDAPEVEPLESALISAASLGPALLQDVLRLLGGVVLPGTPGLI